MRLNSLIVIVFDTNSLNNRPNILAFSSESKRSITNNKLTPKLSSSFSNLLFIFFQSSLSSTS